jgi:hypothetical protein
MMRREYSSSSPSETDPEPSVDRSQEILLRIERRLVAVESRLEDMDLDLQLNRQNSNTTLFSVNQLIASNQQLRTAH